VERRGQITTRLSERAKQNSKKLPEDKPTRHRESVDLRLPEAGKQGRISGIRQLAGGTDFAESDSLDRSGRKMVFMGIYRAPKVNFGVS
jgi:hypothetical protein